MPMQADRVFVGVDVAKSTLVVSRHGAATHQCVDNEAAAIARWLRQLPAEAVIAMESTGEHHLLLARLAHQCGRVVYVLNARDVYFYAKGLGARGKTDRLDAQVIARYAAEHHGALHPWKPGSGAEAAVQSLLQRRAQVVVHRNALRSTLRGQDGLAQALATLEDQFEQLLAQIDHQVAQWLHSAPQLRTANEQLRTITGMGAQGAALLAALLSRLRFANADALVAYSGLDPRPNDSGAKTGRRRLSKRGNPLLRRQLYLVAFAASHSKALGPLYRALKAKGFKSTEALIILARKLLRVAWAVWRTGKPFDPARFATSPCVKT
jgi:transposase